MKIFEWTARLSMLGTLDTLDTLDTRDAIGTDNTSREGFKKETVAGVKPRRGEGICLKGRHYSKRQKMFESL